MLHTYETDGAKIYAESFATIRAEAKLTRFTKDEESVAVRMIHAAGMVGLEDHIRFSPHMAEIARTALAQGAPILCDAYMVSEGITRPRLPADNEVICTLHAEGIYELAKEIGKLDADIQQIDKKLANENFVSRAPKHVVEEQHTRRADWTAAKEKLQDALSTLESIQGD